MKLLYYDTREALSQPDLTEDQKLEVLEKNIKTVPKIYIDSELKTYININFDMFEPSENPEFRDNIIIFDIVCHVDNWQLKDFQQRPYKIAGELDFMFNKKRLTGIGEIQFVSCNQIAVNGDYFDVCLMYHTIHGEEDKKGMLNPTEEADFIKEFNDIYNS